MVALGIGAFVLISYSLGLPILGSKQSLRSNVQGNVRSIVQAQRTTTTTSRKGGKPQTSIYQSAAEQGKLAHHAAGTARLTLEKKIKYSAWKIAPVIFYCACLTISLFSFFVVSQVFDAVLQFISLITGPLFMHWLINTAMHKRFKAFDRDYPQFLLSLVGLLKTGMNTLTALQAAAEGMDEGSLVKSEIELMLERLRIGVSEDQSIGSLGEDIYHEEIELFVQALLLSRRVGGNLSDTLDRLAKQVRKRQYFRESAYAAIGQQRWSIVVIVGVLVFILGYMLIIAPDIVLGAYHDPVGWQVYQGGVMVILLGVYWIRQVTKIRV